MEDVDPKLLRAEEDVRQLLEELKPKRVVEDTPLGSRETPYEEEMRRMHASGKFRTKGRMV